MSSEYLIGRSPRCDLVLSSKLVSSQHAQLRWTGQGWQLHDLASRNGSYIDGSRVREPHELKPRMLLAFGDPNIVHEVIDVKPPIARAIDQHGQTVTGMGQFLCIPNPDDYQYMVFAAAPGDWRVETAEGERRQVCDGDHLRTGDQHWTLELPHFVERTMQAHQPRFVRTQATVRFSVDTDEQLVAIELVQAGEREYWPARIHHLMLVRLAKERHRDHRAGLPHDQQGWLFVDELQDYYQEICGRSPTLNTLNQYVRRTREQFLAADMVDAFNVIERVKAASAHDGTLAATQRSSGKIRLGVRHIEIVRASRPGPGL